MPPISRLPCLHPQCPQSFKSQNGRTYHMRSVHDNSNQQPVDVEEIQENENTHPGDLPANDGGSLAQRIEHPHLTGMCRGVPFKSLTINAQPFHAAEMVASCQQVHHLIPVRQHHKAIGRPLIVKSSSRSLTFFIAVPSYPPQRSMHFWSYGRNPLLSLTSLHRLAHTKRCTVLLTHARLGTLPGSA